MIHFAANDQENVGLVRGTVSNDNAPANSSQLVQLCLCSAKSQMCHHRHLPSPDSM
jgi:hypothetical protein